MHARSGPGHPTGGSERRLFDRSAADRYLTGGSSRFIHRAFFESEGSVKIDRCRHSGRPSSKSVLPFHRSCRLLLHGHSSLVPRAHEAQPALERAGWPRGHSEVRLEGAAHGGGVGLTKPGDQQASSRRDALRDLRRDRDERPREHVGHGQLDAQAGGEFPRRAGLEMVLEPVELRIPARAEQSWLGDVTRVAARGLLASEEP
mmetsp:Transcript_45617/g.97155  ORF Transcript_45617/g.97155 Transcript_45617/m.97155 type:complete len:203 (-) Transcript_45617:666-1274(-)